MNTDKLDIGELEYLEGYVNNHKLIKREPIKILFASQATLEKFKIDSRLTDVDEFGLTGDIGLLRDEVDEYSKSIKETIIFTNSRNLRSGSSPFFGRTSEEEMISRGKQLLMNLLKKIIKINH